MTRFVSLRRKVTLALFAALGGSLGITFLALGIIEYRATEVRARTSLESLGNALAFSLAASLDFDSPETAELYISQLAPSSQVIGVTVFRWPVDGARPPFAQYRRPGSAPVFPASPHVPGFTRAGDRVLLVQRVETGGLTVGLLLLEADIGNFQRGYHEMLALLAGILLLIGGALLVLSRGLQRLLTRPLLQLSDTAAQVHQTGNFSLRAEVHTSDEIGRLADSFNEMLAGIASRDRQLAEQAAFQRAVLENAGSAVISSDLDGIVRTFNAGAERLLQYSRDEVIGRFNATRFHTTDELAQHAATLSSQAGSPVAPDFHVFVELARLGSGPQEWTYVRKDGSLIPVVLIVSQLRTADDRHIGYCGIATDLTERKAAEQRHRTIIQTTIDGFWILDHAGRILDVNDAICRMLGYRREEILGTSIPSLEAKESAAEVSAHLARIVRSGTDHFETGLRRCDGSVLSAELSINHLPGPVGGYSVFIRDITERKSREEALARSEARFRIVAERTGQLIFDCDVASGRVDWTGAAIPMIGYSCDFLAAHGPEWWREQIHPDDLAHASAIWGQLHQRGRIDQFIYRFRRADSSWCHLMTNAVVIEGPDGRPQRILAAIADVTMQQEAAEAVRQLNAELEQRVRERTTELDRRIAEVEQLNTEQQQLMGDLRTSQDSLAGSAARLQEANSNLLAANQELESFSYSVSHDLRAPLRNIAGFIELLRKRTAGQLDSEADRYFGIVGSEAVRMGALIDDLLTFSRIGRAELHFAPVQLAALVAEVQTELHSDLTNRQIEWRIQPLPPVLGDRTLLRQVVANLLANAVKFTRQRTPAIIEIGTQPAPASAGLVTFFVRDNGAGFDPKYTAKLFGVFQRLHNPRDYEGTGIGLANVKRIVNRHGGHVWAEGEPDRGATFFFSLKPASSQ